MMCAFPIAGQLTPPPAPLRRRPSPACPAENRKLLQNAGASASAIAQAAASGSGSAFANAVAQAQASGEWAAVHGTALRPLCESLRGKACTYSGASTSKRLDARSTSHPCSAVCRQQATPRLPLRQLPRRSLKAPDRRLPT